MKNRTVMNMVRSMLSSKNIPKIFWPEVVNWTVYVLNKCPTLVGCYIRGGLEWSETLGRTFSDLWVRVLDELKCCFMVLKKVAYCDPINNRS